MKMIVTNELRIFGNHVQKFRRWEKRTVTLKKQWKTSEIITLSEPTTEALVNQSSMATRRSTSIQKKSLFVRKRRLWQFDIWVRKAWCVRRGLHQQQLFRTNLHRFPASVITDPGKNELDSSLLFSFTLKLW